MSTLAKRSTILLLTFLLCLFAVLWLSVLLFRHFLIVFAVSASVAILLEPLNLRLTALLRGRRTLSSSLLVLSTVLVILVPLMAAGTMIGNQAASLLADVQSHLTQEAVARYWDETLPSRYPWLTAVRSGLQLDNEKIAQMITPVLSRLAGMAPRILQETVARLAQTLFYSVMFLFMLFFLLRDGHLLAGFLRAFSPLSREQEEEAYDHLYKTVRGVLLSTLLVPIAQGLLAIIGFSIFGLPAAFFWGAMLILAAVIPGIGSPLIWFPAGVYLIASGAKGQGIGLLLYGALLISSIDNILKPVILGGSARIHPLLGFLSILGGILSFGFLGFLIGPVILSLLMSTVRIYRGYMSTGLAAPDQQASPG